MKSRFSILLMLAVLPFFLTLTPFQARADDYENYQADTKAIDGYSREINDARHEVSGAVSTAMGSPVDDPAPWKNVTDKMDRFAQILPNNLSAMDAAVGRVMKTSPTAYIPTIDLNNPFDGALIQVAEREKQVLRAVNELNRTIASLDQQIAKFRNALLKANAQYYNEAIDGFFPGRNELLGEAAVAGLGATGAVLTMNPAFLAGAGLAYAAVATFTGFYNLYQNTQSLAEQAKIFRQMTDQITARKAELEELKRSLDPALQEVKLVRNDLGVYKKQYDELRGDALKVIDGWKAKASQANADQQKELAKRTEELMNKPQPTIQLGSNYYGMEPMPPLTPGDYAAEARSMIGAMESACRAVEDGGEPGNYREISWAFFYRMNEQYQSVRNDYDAKMKLYGQASEVCYRAMNEAYDRYSRANAAAWAAYRAGQINSGQLWAAYDANNAAYQAAVQAAYAQLRPYGKAMIQPAWQLSRLYKIYSMVGDADSLFMQRVSMAMQFRSTEFWRSFREAERRLEDARWLCYTVTQNIPYEWTIESWKKRTEGIEGEVEKALAEGSDPVALRNGLLAASAQLKEVGDVVKQAAKAYDEAHTQWILLANVSKTELNHLLTTYGKLVNHQGIYYPSPSWLGGQMEARFPVDLTATDRQVEYLTELVETLCKVSDIETVKLAKNTDWSGMAATFAGKAADLDFYVDWIESFRNRLATASFRVDGISIEQTGQSLYGNRGGDVNTILKKEFSEPQWQAIAQGATDLAPADQFNKLPWAKFQPWESMTPWQKLYAAEQILMNRMLEEVKYYIQIRQSGGFQPIPDKNYQSYKETWTKLRALGEKHDALAVAATAKIGDAPDQIGKEFQAVLELYQKMPTPSRNAVTASYNRFRDAMNWLISYLNQKKESLKTLTQPPTNSLFVQLDNLITPYEPALAKYREQEERNRRFAEEQQRKFEEQRRQEEEQKQRADEAIRLQQESEQGAIRELYAGFKEAYEARNDGHLMGLISGDWSAGDGTTLSDLQANFRRIFSVFDEVRYNIQNLNVQKTPRGTFAVSYDVIITSRIYRRNLKHEEKSTVNEEVALEEGGKAKILRTLSGRFWYVE